MLKGAMSALKTHQGLQGPETVRWRSCLKERKTKTPQWRALNLPSWTSEPLRANQSFFYDMYVNRINLRYWPDLLSAKGRGMHVCRRRLVSPNSLRGRAGVSGTHNTPLVFPLAGVGMLLAVASARLTLLQRCMMCSKTLSGSPGLSRPRSGH